MQLRMQQSVTTADPSLVYGFSFFFKKHCIDGQQCIEIVALMLWLVCLGTLTKLYLLLGGPHGVVAFSPVLLPMVRLRPLIQPFV